MSITPAPWLPRSWGTAALVALLVVGLAGCASASQSSRPESFGSEVEFHGTAEIARDALVEYVNDAISAAGGEPADVHVVASGCRRNDPEGVMFHYAATTPDGGDSTVLNRVATVWRDHGLEVFGETDPDRVASLPGTGQVLSLVLTHRNDSDHTSYDVVGFSVCMPGDPADFLETR